MNRLPHK